MSDPGKDTMVNGRPAWLRAVRILANQAWVRYWRHYNYPAVDRQIAISVKDAEGKPQRVDGLVDMGFAWRDGMHVASAEDVDS